MFYQKRVFPSTSMLLAFDAAAKTGNFTAAAKELNLTQGAVSRQISALENQLDVIFFIREKKTVRLTDIGKTYAQEIRIVLTKLRSASLNAMTSKLDGTLNLAILPTFGTRWLMPRIPHFLKKHPEISVNFVNRLSEFDFQTENLHCAIHYGTPDWKDTSSTFLMSEEVVPVCSSIFYEKEFKNNLDNLTRLPLLHLETRPNAWRNWLLFNDIDPPQEQGMLFEEFSTIAQAAVAGLGAALLPTILIQGELKRKELVTISKKKYNSDAGYYLVTPLNKADYAPNFAFRDWLLEVINKSD